MDNHAVKRTPVLSLLQSTVAWATLSITLLLVTLYGGNSPAYWTLFGIGIFFLFAFQAALSALRGGHPRNIRLRVPALLYLAVLAWGLFQVWPGVPTGWTHPFWDLVPEADATISATPVAGAHGVLRLATYAMVFWIAVQASMNAKRSWRCLCAIALFSTVLALFGLYAVLSGANPVLLEQATSNVSATFVNRNSYALYAAMGVVSNLGLYLDLVTRDDRPVGSRGGRLRNFLERFFSIAWIFLFGAVICLSALLLTASRAGVASGLMAAVLVLVLLGRGSKGTRMIWLVAVVFLGAFLTVLSENVLTRVLGMEGGSRFVIYAVMFDHLGDRLVQGHGFGAFQDTFRPLVPLEVSGAEWARAHSTYLENLWEMGLPAALAFYAALIWMAVVIFRGAVNRKRNRIFSVVALACLVAGALHSLVDFSLQIPATTALFAFLLGMGWAHAWPSVRSLDEPEDRSETT